MGVLGLSYPVAAGRSSGPPVVVLRLVNQGQVRLAHREITKMLASNPSDPELHAAYGATLAASAFYPDAVLAFEDALGSVWYENRGFSYHAKALGRVGRGAEGAELRRSHLLMQGWPETPAAMSARGKMVQDLLESGDFVAAAEAAEEMTLDFPTRSYAWAHLAWVQVLQGEQDEASWSLFQARRFHDKDVRLEAMARSFWMLEEGRLLRADHELQDFWEDGFKDPELWWLRLEVSRVSGLPEECVDRAEMPRFSYQNEPAFTAVYVRCLVDVGRETDARSTLADALAQHPGNLHLLRASADLDLP